MPKFTTYIILSPADRHRDRQFVSENFCDGPDSLDLSVFKEDPIHGTAIIEEYLKSLSVKSVEYSILQIENSSDTDTFSKNIVLDDVLGQYKSNSVSQPELLVGIPKETLMTRLAQYKPIQLEINDKKSLTQ